MKVPLLSLVLLLFTFGARAQTAQTVLDKTAANLSKDCISITYIMSGAQSGNGNLTIQGKKFVAMTSQGKAWFDGKTLWSMPNNAKEVDVTTPTAKEIAEINPLNFIILYKKGYTAKIETKGESHEVRQTATDSRHYIKECYLTVNKNSYLPQIVRLQIGKSGWTTIKLSSIKKSGKKSDSFFRFDTKQYPKVSVNDLR